MKRLRWLTAAVLVLAWGSAGEAAGQAPSAANDRCANGARVGSEDCDAEAYLLEVLRTDGVSAAMAALEVLVARDADVRRDAHSYAHAIGIAAYTGAEEVGEVFARCTPAHQSGCYHGVIQSYFAHQMEQRGGDLDAALVNALCREQREDAEARWLLFQCAHGMGHGLVMLAGGHLPMSLEGCDLVRDGWEREACYGGVFMENIVSATVPHHFVGRPDAEGGHHAAGPTADHQDHQHDHGGAGMAAAAEDFPPLRADDPLYPCNALAERYGPACYQMQTSAILHFNGYDVPAAAETCSTAPEFYRMTCFQSLGRDISALSGQNHSRAIELCGNAPVRYQPWCHLGYAKNLIDLTAVPADGFEYCRLLAAGESKHACYVAIGEQIWVLHEAVERREELCGASEPSYLDACRHGAGLPAEPTATVDPERSGAAAVG